MRGVPAMVSAGSRENDGNIGHRMPLGQSSCHPTPHVEYPASDWEAGATASSWQHACARNCICPSETGEFSCLVQFWAEGGLPGEREESDNRRAPGGQLNFQTGQQQTTFLQDGGTCWKTICR